MAIREVIGKLISGVISKRFPTRMNMNSDSRYGKYLRPSGPMIPTAMSSRTSLTSDSMLTWNFVGMRLGRRYAK